MSSIRCWRLEDAPKTYRTLFTDAGSQDWIIVVPHHYERQGTQIASQICGDSHEMRRLNVDTLVIRGYQNPGQLVFPESGVVDTNRFVGLGE
jgi:hypothetical protein